MLKAERTGKAPLGSNHPSFWQAVEARPILERMAKALGDFFPRMLWLVLPKALYKVEPAHLNSVLWFGDPSPIFASFCLCAHNVFTSGISQAGQAQGRWIFSSSRSLSNPTLTSSPLLSHTVNSSRINNGYFLLSSPHFSLISHCQWEYIPFTVRRKILYIRSVFYTKILGIQLPCATHFYKTSNPLQCYKILQATFATVLIIKYLSLKHRLTPVCHSMVRGKDKCSFPIISIKMFKHGYNLFYSIINYFNIVLIFPV